MCGRLVQVWDEALGRFVQRYVGTDEVILADLRALERVYNVPPSSDIGAIVNGSGARLAVVRWGFRVPVAGREREVFNARIEEARSPMWRRMARAVVPVQGFFEWTGADARVPHYIQRADGDPMLLAALHSQGSVSIVTCPPDGLMARIHDRMPSILEPEGMQAWLDGGPHVAPTAPLVEREVSRRVNSVANEGPELLRPDPQSRLF